MIGVIRVPIVQRRIAWLVARRGASGSAVFGMRYADHSDRRNEKGNGDMADKEYIERGALIDFLKQEIKQCENDLAESCGDDRYEQAVDSRMTAFLEVLRRVERNTAADVVEVVRCKDCGWSRMIVVNGKPEYYCQCWNPGNGIHVDARGFCVWGERKEQR